MSLAGGWQKAEEEKAWENLQKQSLRNRYHNSSPRGQRPHGEPCRPMRECNANQAVTIPSLTSLKR